MRQPVAFLLAWALLLPTAVTAAQAVSRDETAGYYFMLARHFESRGQIDEATDALRRAMELQPESAELHAELAGLYARQNKAAESLDAAEQAIAIDPENREANRLLGSIYTALAEQKRALRPGDDPAQYASRAIAALEKARGDARSDLGLELTLGRLYLNDGRTEPAIAALQRVFTEQPEYPEGGMLLAAAQEQAGRIDEAITTLEGTIRHNPTFFRAYVRAIELYERRGRWADAAGAYALARSINPRADLTAGHAAALLNGGEPADARSMLEKAIEAAPAPDAALLYLLAESQRQVKDYPAASATLATLRKTFPDDVRGLMMDAQLKRSRGERAAALAAFASLVARVPDAPGIGYQYAQLLEEDGRLPEAERVLRDVLSRDPKNATALNALGYMFADRGIRLAEAVELLQRALTIEPGNPSFLDSLGWAFFRQGQLREAEAPLVEAAAKLPRNSVIHDHLGDLRFRQARYAEAVAAWERALAGDGESIDRAAIQQKLREARALAVAR